MSEGKHTPGPWTAFYKNKYDEWHVSLPITGSSMKLALCSDGIQSENREADAHLIAAAPDLLEALKKIVVLDTHLVWTGGSVPEPSHEEMGEIAKIAVTAIAKAEGRS